MKSKENYLNFRSSQINLCVSIRHFSVYISKFHVQLISVSLSKCQVEAMVGDGSLSYLVELIDADGESVGPKLQKAGFAALRAAVDSIVVQPKDQAEPETEEVLGEFNSYILVLINDHSFNFFMGTRRVRLLNLNSLNIPMCYFFFI